MLSELTYALAPVFPDRTFEVPPDLYWADGEPQVATVPARNVRKA